MSKYDTPTGDNSKVKDVIGCECRMKMNMISTDTLDTINPIFPIHSGLENRPMVPIIRITNSN